MSTTLLPYVRLFGEPVLTLFITLVEACEEGDIASKLVELTVLAWKAWLLVTTWQRLRLARIGPLAWRQDLVEPPSILLMCFLNLGAAAAAACCMTMVSAAPHCAEF